MGQHGGIVDRATAEAINKAYELMQALRRFRIPGMDSIAILRLRRVGVLRLGDVMRPDTELLHDMGSWLGSVTADGTRLSV